MKLRVIPFALSAMIAMACAPVSAHAPAQASPAGVIRGFLGGWPAPDGKGEPGVTFWVSALEGEPTPATCVAPRDSAVTDSTGAFRLRMAGRSLLCMGGRFGRRSVTSRGAGLRVLILSPSGADSVRLYCRSHGPTGSPACLPLSWAQPNAWPGEP